MKPGPTCMENSPQNIRSLIYGYFYSVLERAGNVSGVRFCRIASGAAVLLCSFNHNNLAMLPCSMGVVLMSAV